MNTKQAWRREASAAVALSLSEDAKESNEQRKEEAKEKTHDIDSQESHAHSVERRTLSNLRSK